MIISSRREENSTLLTSLLLWNSGREWHQPCIWARWICEMDLNMVWRRVCAVSLSQHLKIGLFVQEGNRARSQIRAYGLAPHCLRWPWAELQGMRQWEAQTLETPKRRRAFAIHSLFWHPCQKSTDHRCTRLFLDSHFYSIGLYATHSLLSIQFLHEWKLSQRHD